MGREGKGKHLEPQINQLDELLIAFLQAKALPGN